MSSVDCKLCVGAREALGLTQQQLADKAGVSRLTVFNFEQGHNVRPATKQKIRNALERLGVEFTDGEKPGFLLDPAVVR